MTLFRQQILYLTVFLTVLFAGNFIVTVDDARRYHEIQLLSHAQDTATALGVAIASIPDESITAIDALIDAVFDRGFYHRIRFTDLSGNILVNSEHTMVLDGVPAWFMKIVPLESPTVSTTVNRGWMPAGQLSVSSHPGEAYRALWKTTRNKTLLFLSLLILAIAGLFILLKIVLKPLQKMTDQAEAICRRHFYVQDSLPRTRDLRRVIEAMNRMVEKLNNLFADKAALASEFRRRFTQDALTGLLSPENFTLRADRHFQSEDGAAGGTLILIQLSGWEGIVRQIGASQSEVLLTNMVARLTSTIQLWPNALIGQRNKTGFQIFLAPGSLTASQPVVESCFRSLASLEPFINGQGRQALHLSAITSTGYCSLATLLQCAEQQVKQLQLQGENNWQLNILNNMSTQNPSESHQMTEDWLSLIHQALHNKDITLDHQPAININNNTLFHELFARLHINHELVPAAAFLPIVERHGLHTTLDNAIIELLEQWTKIPQDGRRPMPTGNISINIEPLSLMDNHFFTGLINKLKNRPLLAQRLIIETSERIMLLAHSDELVQRIQTLHALGCRFALDHFGLSDQSLSCLHRLNPDYIKLDGSLTHQITENEDNQVYIRMLAILSNSRDFILMAQHVESEEQWTCLKRLGISTGQGRLFGKPEPVN
ncbi:RNase E specificity factor CsrD [invertebrate metagenome]|uniref:RNase E specificity factor CsrD n=1 Tax=invertebrate metagenome TaxID=1711999 RepID=A0A2H9T9B6_9ZZZZ